MQSIPQINGCSIALQTTEKGNENVNEKAVNADVNSRNFFEWLVDEMCLTTASAQYYSSIIDVVSSYAKQIYGVHESIYDIDSLEEIEQLLNKMMADKCIIQGKLNYCFEGAFEKYVQYMRFYTRKKSYEIIEKNSNEENILEDIEKIIREADIDGITLSDISDITGKSIWLVKKYLQILEGVIEIPGNVYVHVDNVVDIHENKEEIQKIIENQFAKFAGYTNDVVLFDAASITLGMFLNDNCIDKPEKMYGITRYLFEKVYIFAGDKHIWKGSPQYTTTYAGVLLGYISSNGGKTSKAQCTEYLQKVKLPSNNINGILSIATNKRVLLYGNEEYVLADYVIRDELWLEQLKIQIGKLFRQALYVVPREISDNWFELLPILDGGISWNLMLLQDLIKKYLPEYRLITANENQGLETIRAGIVPEDSFIENFADLVYIRILEDATVSLPVRIDKEDFRKKLIEYKMIQGNELIYTMPKAVAGSKFAWTSEGDSVLILKE